MRPNAAQLLLRDMQLRTGQCKGLTAFLQVGGSDSMLEESGFRCTEEASRSLEAHKFNAKKSELSGRTQL